VQLALDGLAGVTEVRVLLPSHELQVTYDPDKVTPQDIVAAVRHAPAAGESGSYDAEPLDRAPQTTPPSNP
jgi:copper chaperone CopZ